MNQLVLAIPTYNCARFLPATLASLNAEGDRVRWYLQDGASDDGSVEVAESFRRPGDVVVSEPDSGQTDALNRAFKRMGGEIVGFINGDDCLLPGAAESVLKIFDEHPEVDLVCGEIEWIDVEGDVQGSHTGRINSLREMLDIYNVWWNRRQWVQPEVFYRRSLWERVGGFDTQYHLAFDYDFWVRCFLAGARVRHLSRPLAQFRHHNAQKSRAAEQAADEIRNIVQRHLGEARLPFGGRVALQARLSYDRYQSGRQSGPRQPLWSELLRHPEWLSVPEVRRRLQTACSARLSRAQGLPPSS